ncbi:ac19 [Sucra jujuba nucleopolyhedrovirus]|uniref:Ac19 n=1 Tax=Sucra jujuba nucleopolyhedrovirus TaxID=1563660 RepID=A0A097P956_9ABAC|nr:ac19 [Sucra jujuba nucleopolyhedrovirus]AIU41362.1 ac19 [Sucra jujuba nucleopolyhedrovirus]
MMKSKKFSAFGLIETVQTLRSSKNNLVANRRNGRPQTDPSTTFLSNIRNVFLNVNTTTVGAQQLFYNICFQFVAKNLICNSVPFITIQTVLNGLIELERIVFGQNRILKYIVKFLVDHSDGNNLQCLINVQLLDYFLTNYNHDLHLS